MPVRMSYTCMKTTPHSLHQLRQQVRKVLSKHVNEFVLNHMDIGRCLRCPIGSCRQHRFHIEFLAYSTAPKAFLWRLLPRGWNEKCLRKLPRISYRGSLDERICKAQGDQPNGSSRKPLLASIKQRKLAWFGHVTRHGSLWGKKNTWRLTAKWTTEEVLDG